jgi:excisionase family DNA binding protein
MEGSTRLQADVLPLTLRVREAARLLGVCERTVQTWIRKHGLPCIRLGRSVRIPLDGLRAWVEEQARRQAKTDRNMGQWLEEQARKEGGE